MDEFNRWSQVVRGRGAVEILGHYPIDVPPIGAPATEAVGRPGVRLLVRPLESEPTSPMIDVTATAVIAMLEGFLATGAHIGKRIEWQARGFGSRRRDTLILTRASS